MVVDSIFVSYGFVAGCGSCVVEVVRTDSGPSTFVFVSTDTVSSLVDDRRMCRPFVRLMCLVLLKGCCFVCRRCLPGGVRWVCGVGR